MIRGQDFGEVTRFDLAARGRCLLGGYWTTCYRLGDLLIDTGPVHRGKALCSALARTPIRKVLLTHSHEDHIGGTAAVRRAFPGAEVLAHPACLAVLRDPRREQPQQVYRRLIWGWPEVVERGTPLGDGDRLSSGPYHLRVVHTPGHSADHLCFFEEDRGYCFTGDLYVGGEDFAIRHDADVWAIIRSLERLLELRPKMLFPGAARVPADPLDALGRKIDHYRRLGDRILALHARGWSEARIAREVLGRGHRIEWLTQRHFTRVALVRSYLRHVPKD